MLLDDLLISADTAPPTANKIVMHAVAGAGKTSFFAHAPDVLFIPCHGEESGIRKLAEAKLIPETVKWVPEIKSTPDTSDGWMKLLTFIHEHLVKGKHPFKTIVFDCADDDGFLDMAYRHHCNEEYEGDMGPAGFMSFQNGYQTVLPEIKRLTHRLLQRLVDDGIDVVLLMHSQVGNYKNPDGADYTRHLPLVNQRAVWPMIEGWADMVLFMAPQTSVKVSDGGDRGKGKGGSKRVLYCEHRATHEAKNRHGLPASLLLPDNPADAYAAFQAALKGGTN